MRQKLIPLLAASVLGLASPASAADTAAGPKADSGGIPGPAIGGPAGGAPSTLSAAPELQLTEAQRQAVRQAALREDTHQPTPKDFTAQRGGSLPPAVNLHPLPRPLVYEVPALKDYMYASLDREVLIVDALNKKVVDVIALKPEEARTQPPLKQAELAAVGGLPQLDAARRHAIYQAIPAEGAQAVPQGEALKAGSEVPGSMTLQPLPETAAGQAADVQGLQYARLQDGRVLLVDPQTRKVAGIITQDEGTRIAGGDGGAAGPGQPAANTGVGPAGGDGAGGERDPLKAREQSGRPSAYTGPSTVGPSTGPQ